VTAPVWPAQFNMVLKTNNFGTQTRWQIVDLNGNIVAERNPTAAQATFTDPVSITTNGAYKLIVTDDGCDGLYWWANVNNGAGSGWLYTQNQVGNIIPYDNGLPPFPNVNPAGDFGCGFTQYFRVNSNLPTSVSTIDKKYDITVDPNPFTERLVISIASLKPEKAIVRLFDMNGRLVATRNIRVAAGISSIELRELQDQVKGMYLVEVKGESISFSKKIMKQ
jgi:hypothetical protein